MTEMPGDASAGRLYIEAVSDTSGFSRELKRKIDAEVRNVRARIKAEIDSRGLATSAKRSAQEASKAAVIRVKAQVDARGLKSSVVAAAREASRAAVIRVKVEPDVRGLTGKVTAATVEARRAAEAVSQVKFTADTGGMVGETVAAAKGAAAAAKSDVKVGADTGEAVREILATKAMGERTPVTIPVKGNVDPLTRSLTQAGRALSGLTKIPAIAGGVFLLGSAAVNAAGGLFAMGSAASQAAGALAILPNLAGIAAQGIGSLLVGFSGIGAAVEALGKTEQAAATVSTGAAGQRAAAQQAVADAHRAVGEAARNVAAAERGVGDAQRAAGDAARALEDAHRAVADARRGVQDALRAEAAAVRGVEDAQRGLTDARREAADAAEDAADQVRAANEAVGDSERAVSDAQESTLRAQQALNDAREEARERIRDLNMELRHSATDEAAAVLALKQARQDLQDVKWDKTSTGMEVGVAEQGVQEALDNLERVRERNGDLARETQEANAKGVSGSDEVVAARDAVEQAIQTERDAIEAQRDAVDALAEAEENQADVASQGARRIADARRALADAERGVGDAERATADARRGVAAAQRGVAEATRGVADAQRGIEDAHRGVADAERALADARRQARQATQGATAAAGPLATALAAQEDAFENLSPAGRRFARFLYGLKPRMIEFRNAVQTALLPPLQRGIRKALPLLDTLQTGMVESATIVGRFGKRLGTLFGSALFRGDVATIMASNNRALRSFTGTGMNLVNIFRHLGVAVGPLVEKFARWTRKLTAGWEETLKAKRETGELTAFFRKAGNRAAQLGDIIGNLVGAIFGMGKAAAPAGADLLNSFEKVTEKWNKWANSDAGQKRMGRFFEATKPVTKELGRLVSNLTEFLIKLGEGGGGPAAGFLAAINSVFDALNKLLSIPGVAKIVGWFATIIGFAAGLGFVGGRVLGIVGAVRRLFTAMKTLMPIFLGIGRWVFRLASGFGRLLMWLMRSRAIMAAVRLGMIALRIAFVALTGPVGWIIGIITLIAAGLVMLYKRNETFRKFVDKAWAKIKEIIASAWRNVIQPIFKAVVWYVKNVLIPIWSALWSAAKTMFKAIWGVIKWWWGIVSGIFTAVKQALSGDLSGAFDTLKETAANAFGKLLDVIRGIPDKIGRLGRLFRKAAGNLWDAFLAGIGNAKDFLGDVGGKVWDAVKKLLNKGIAKINDALEFEIPLPGPNISVNPPNIPQLAGGGRVRRATLAMIGEGDEPETVLPDSMLRGLLERTAGAAAGAGRAAVGTAIDVGGLALDKQSARKVTDTFADVGNSISKMWKRKAEPALDSWNKSITDNVAPAVDDLLTKTVRPVTAKIGDGMRRFQRGPLKKHGDAWAHQFNDRIAPNTRDLLTETVRPVADKIGGEFASLREGPMSTLGTRWREQFKTTMPGQFRDLRSSIGATWREGIKSTLDTLGTYIKDEVAPKFRRGVTAIGNAWERLKNVTKRPVRFLITTVLNQGIIKSFNKIAKFVGGKKADLMEKITLPQGLAGGGPVEGPWRGPRADNVLIRANPKEEVTRAESAESMRRRYPGYLEYINKHGQPPGYADGGTVGRGRGRGGRGDRVWPTIGRQVSTYSGHDGVDINDVGEDKGDPIWAAADGRITYVGSGRGYGEPAVFIDHGAAEYVYGHLMSAHVRAGQRVQAGDHLGRLGSTGRSTGPHLHFGIPNGTYSQALAFLQGATVRDSSGRGNGAAPTQPQVPGWIRDIVGDVPGYIEGLTEGIGDSDWAQMVAKVPMELAGPLSRELNQMVGSLAGASAGAFGPGAEGIFKSLMSTGFYSVKQAAGVMGNMMIESGLVPNIVQGGGHAALPHGISSGWGLVQWTPGTKVLSYLNGDGSIASQVSALTAQLRGKGSSPEAYAGQKLRATNSVAGATYAFGEYYERPKSLSSTINERQRYAEGFYDRFKNMPLHDDGGWLMPGMPGFNATRKPEAVLDDEESDAFVMLAKVAATLRKAAPVAAPTGGGGDQPLIGSLALSVGDRRDIPEALQQVDTKFRVIRRGGVHQRARRTA